YLKPQDFESQMSNGLDARLNMPGAALPDDARVKAKIDKLRELIKDKLSSRLGWQPRCKPTILPSKRILLPLYSDTFSAGLMAISDDGGKSWYASQPLAGF